MKFNTIVLDPPWRESMVGKFDRRPNRPDELPYDTMTIDEIKQFPLKNFAEAGSHIYLWTTNAFLRKAFEVFDSWGVNFHLVLVGTKPSGVAPNCGYIFGTEFCLLGFYGKPMQKWLKIGRLNWFQIFNPAGKHSSKPDYFYEMLEEMSPAPRIDIFARKRRKGWSVWGNEVSSHVLHGGIS